MKIVHVITRLILGGAQENTLLTCEGLHARGHEVTLVTGPTLGPEGELVTRAKAGGYRLIEEPTLRREINPLVDLRAYVALKRLLRELAPDVVHTHSSKAGIVARRAAGRVGGMKVVHTVHGLPFHPYQSRIARRLYVSLERGAAKRSDAIISVADAMTQQALAAGVGTPQQYRTIYSGMEVEHFIARPPQADVFRQALGVPEDAVVVTQLSRLAELKGHEFIIEAAASINNPRVYFCLVGDGHWRPRIEAAINERGLARRFRLTGLIPPRDVPAALHASDIVVHCSLREGLARALPQAMLAGKPVVSFDVDGAREVVTPDTGILLAPRDVSGLKFAIETLADSPPLRAKLGAAGLQLCRQMFDHNRMVDRIETLYRELLASR